SGALAKIFGVRHLSPTGAWHLGNFIEEIDPTAILIEGPSVGSELLKHLAHAKTRPPVALLAFTKERPVRSILYPLAAYSPEWIALTIGLRKKRLVRFIDLPAATFLALRDSYQTVAGQDDLQDDSQASSDKKEADKPESAERGNTDKVAGEADKVEHRSD